MIKILPARQIKELDDFTIKNEPIASIDLMERACHAFVTWFVERFDASKKIGIVCGTGNNGGDGLGIARLLKAWNYSVKVWIVRGAVPETGDFKVNLERLRDKAEVFEIISDSDRGLFTGCDVLVDAIFGSGLSRTVDGIYAQAIQCINQTDAIRVAVDIPSGLMADKTSDGSIVQADYTVSFQMPKLAFLFPSSHKHVGKWFVVDIGLNKLFLKQSNASNLFVTAKDVKKRLRHRSTYDHKGTFGHALLIAGSYGKVGASVLSARATLRSGVGLLTVHTPREGYNILQISVPEAMCSIDDHSEFITTFPAVDPYSVIGIGPGLGQAKETIVMLEKLLNTFRKPMVIDADALNILSAHRELLSHVPEGSILTPHPGEFERLAGSWADDFERLEKQRALAQRLRSVVVLKGAYSSIASPDGKVYFNPTGNPGMATGGSGDVLTGILTGLLAQGYASIDAAILGVYIHGLAGDLAVHETGMSSMIASDIVTHLPAAFLKMSR